MTASLRRLFLLALVTSVIATGAFAIAALLVGDFGDTEAKIMLTTTAISACSLLALPGGVLLDQNRLRPLAIALFAATTLAFLLALNLIWIQWDDAGDWSFKPFWIAALATGALSQTAAVQSRRQSDDSPAVVGLARLSTVVVTALAVLFAIAVLWEVDSEGFYRAVGAVAVADVVLVVVQPFLRRMRSAAPVVHRLACVVERDGTTEEIEREVRGRDFAAAVESLVRDLERNGARVVRIERR